VRLFLQEQAVIKFVLRAASTLENTDGEQQALCSCSPSQNLYLIKGKCFAPGYRVDNSKTGQ